MRRMHESVMNFYVWLELNWDMSFALQKRLIRNNQFCNNQLSWNSRFLHNIKCAMWHFCIVRQYFRKNFLIFVSHKNFPVSTSVQSPLTSNYTYPNPVFTNFHQKSAVSPSKIHFPSTWHCLYGNEQKNQRQKKKKIMKNFFSLLKSIRMTSCARKKENLFRMEKHVLTGYT